MNRHLRHRIAAVVSALLFALIMSISGSTVAHGELLSIQLPISRASHTFMLWEKVEDPYGVPNAVQLTYGYEGMDILSGWYVRTPITAMTLAGGSFDNNGVWVPGGNPILQGSVTRTASGPYFVMDETASQASRGNSVTLANALWKSLDDPNTFSFYALPAAIDGSPWEGDFFAARAYAWNGSSYQYIWIPLTVSPVQSWVNADGSSQSREGLLPAKPAGYYEEFVHPTPWVKGAGPQRVVRGQGGELYYTADHYESFVPLN